MVVKSTDNMTFSLTDDGQEGHYYELFTKLSALWLNVDADVFQDLLRSMVSRVMCEGGKGE